MNPNDFNCIGIRLDFEELGLLRPVKAKGNQRVFPKSKNVQMKLIIRGKDMVLHQRKLKK